MKTVTSSLSLLLGAILCFATGLSAATQQAQRAPAKWGPGCDQALLDGEFSLSNAPTIPCDKEQREFIDKVINEVSGGYGGTMVLEKSPHPYMDTPEFTSFFLRAFAEPTEPLHDYVYRFERLISRISPHMSILADARLDWEMWRAWLLFENTANTSSSYKDEYEYNGRKDSVIAPLTGARELLWNYLSYNADAILKDPKRRAWWITRLTDGLEAEGGRPQRRWFLLSLLSAADTNREIPVFEKFMDGSHGEKIPMRQPQPYDPFLIVTGTDDKPPAFSDALTKIAFDNSLSLTVLDIDPATQPATTVNSISLAMTKWPSDKTKVINQESWSTPPGKEDRTFGYFGYEWGTRFFRAWGSRDNYSWVHFPEERTDGVFFFVFNWRLYVWPKVKMDAAVIHMLRVANLIDADKAAELEKRGFAPLKETLVKEIPQK